MAYAKARKRRYTNSTRLANKARKAARHERRLAFFADRKAWKEVFSTARSIQFHGGTV